jgi:hypothetical protein
MLEDLFRQPELPELATSDYPMLIRRQSPDGLFCSHMPRVCEGSTEFKTFAFGAEI